MEKKKVYWTPVAIKSLIETKNFILKHWHKQVLEYFLDLVDKRIEQVQINPRIAPAIPETHLHQGHPEETLMNKGEPLLGIASFVPTSR
jgi:hypothetical protein